MSLNLVCCIASVLEGMFPIYIYSTESEGSLAASNLRTPQRSVGTCSNAREEWPSAGKMNNHLWATDEGSAQPEKAG